MKSIPLNEILEAPLTVREVYFSVIVGMPVSASKYKQAINNHPQYFPDEVEHKRKYDLIPQSVHDAYLKELQETIGVIHADLPKTGGWLSLINNSGESDKWHSEYDKIRKKEKAELKRLHEKYYSKYGIKYKAQ